MILVLTLIACPASGFQNTQAPPAGLQVGAPVFRAGTLVVPVGLELMSNRKPWIGLTVSDFEILLDKKPIAPLDVAHEDQAQHRYTVFFQPPDTVQTGRRTHFR